MRYRYFIVLSNTGSLVDAGNSAASGWDPDAGGNTFDLSGASADGSGPATYMICNTLINTDWPTSPRSKISDLAGSLVDEGTLAMYRITGSGAAEGHGGDLIKGMVQRFEDQGGWGFYDFQEGEISSVALDDLGLQKIQAR